MERKQRKGRKKQDKLVLFPEVYTNAVKMTDAQFGALMRAVFAYRFEGSVYEGDDLAVDVSFRAVAGQIDRYAEVCGTNRNNASGEAECSEIQGNSEECTEGQRNHPPNPIPNPIPSPIPNPHTENTAGKPPVVNGSFEKFWSAYPKKVGKQAAKKAFDRVKVPVETLLSAVKRQKCSAQWSRDNGQYIPNPATWLNQGRWDDELEPEKAPQGDSDIPEGLKLVADKNGGSKWVRTDRREEQSDGKNEFQFAGRIGTVV